MKPTAPARPTRRQWLCGAAALGLGPVVAPLHAQAPAGAAPLPPEYAADLPGATLIGQAPLRFLGLHIYDARLWAAAPPGADFAAAPLALELQYARGLSGARIAERSLQEMKRQGPIADADGQRWLSAMKTMFPDVAAGDRLGGLLQPGVGVRFFHNGRPRGDVRDAAFARLFFGIWLSDKTSEPKMRLALLGQRP